MRLLATLFLLLGLPFFGAASENKLPEYGTPGAETIRVKAMGAVARPGIYHLDKKATLQDLATRCGRALTTYDFRLICFDASQKDGRGQSIQVKIDGEKTRERAGKDKTVVFLLADYPLREGDTLFGTERIP